MKSGKRFFIKLFKLNGFLVYFIKAMGDAKINKRFHQWKHELIKL